MVAVLASTLVFTTAWRAADAVDKVTGLPLHPGLDVQQEVNSPVCGHPAHIVLYDTPGTATLAEYLSWYRSQLKGAHYVHKVWSNRAQEMFYSADGSTGVSLTANASGPGVYSVAYMKISTPALDETDGRVRAVEPAVQVARRRRARRSTQVSAAGASG
jgi:hypothetical protein